MAIGRVVWLAFKRILLTADTGGETNKVRLTVRDKLSNIVTVAVPACEDVRVADAVLLATATIWLVVPFPNVPRVVVKVTVVAPGADTVIGFGAFVTIPELFVGEVTASTVVAKPLEKAWDWALPSAEALMLAVPAVTPDTATVATPKLLVTLVVALNPRIAGSVAANDTVIPDIATPNTSLTVAFSVVLAPPTISEDAPELVTATLAPITLI